MLNAWIEYDKISYTRICTKYMYSTCTLQTAV